MNKIFKLFVPSYFLKIRREHLWLKSQTEPVAQRKCNICGFEGWFKSYGSPKRFDALCPSCFSLERQRLLLWAINDKGILSNIDYQKDKVLHFAAEPSLEKIFRKKFKDYATADLNVNSDLQLNLEDIKVPDRTYKLVIAIHVLEHVDDIKACRELNRILTDDGILIVMVPIVEGWEKTYENNLIASDKERQLHFGQSDHLRCYGRDFRDRVSQSGLHLVSEITAEGKEAAEHNFLRGEKVFVFSKLPPAS